jgi:hypothetical protein
LGQIEVAVRFNRLIWCWPKHCQSAWPCEHGCYVGCSLAQALLGSLLMVGLLAAVGSGHVVALPCLCLSAYDELHCGWTNSNGVANLW